MHSKSLKLRGKESRRCFKSQNTTLNYSLGTHVLQSLQENAFTVKEQPNQKNMQKEKKYLYSNSHHSGRNKIMFKLADLELV